MPSVSPATVYTDMRSPLGTLWIASTRNGLACVDFGVDELDFCHRVERRGIGVPRYEPEALEDIVAQLGEYFEGTRRVFDLSIELGGTSTFRRAVLEAVQAVPYGTVRSYGEIACMIGKPGAVRAVGTAVATNPLSLVIPCHRIIRSDGSPGEYARRTLGSRGIDYKLLLLRLEGVALAGSAGIAGAGCRTSARAGLACSVQ